MSTVTPQPIRTQRIENRLLAVYDGLMSAAECQQYFQAMAQSPFVRSEIARPDTADYKHWASEFPLANLAHLPIYPRTLEALGPFARPGIRFQAYRAYTNHAAYGDMLYTHTDCLPGAGELTALWYFCERWDTEWGGETMFYDESGDAVACVSPRPGRLAIFDGAIRHAGRPPNRICYAPRYTFAIKLEPKPI